MFAGVVDNRAFGARDVHRTNSVSSVFFSLCITHANEIQDSKSGSNVLFTFKIPSFDSKCKPDTTQNIPLICTHMSKVHKIRMTPPYRHATQTIFFWPWKSIVVPYTAVYSEQAERGDIC
eukprot:3359580-Pleurochrysis_carterae.AAC.3